MNLYKLLLVGLGGFIGSISRFATVRFVDIRLNAVFPYGTLSVNLIGSFVLGAVYALTLRHTNSAEGWRLFLGAGFCGGFTTFSAFALENFNLLEQKMIGTSVLYMAVSLVAGLLAMAAGVWIARFL